MSTSTKTAYGTSTSIAVDTTTPANGLDANSSGTIDNITNTYVDALLKVKVTTAASGTLASGVVQVTVRPTEGNGDFSDNSNDFFVMTINTAANNTTYVGTSNVALCCGGVMPYQWQLRVHNLSGAALTNVVCAYNGVYSTNA